MTGGPLTVGDPLVVPVALALPPGAALIDRVPRVRDTLPDGVRLLSADSLRIENGKVIGQLRVAFFRADSQVVPSFAIAYRSPTGTDTVFTAPVHVLVHSVLPTGDATLRDVRDVDPPWPVAAISIGLALVLVAVLGLRIVRPRSRVVAQVHVPAAEQGPSPYDVALEQLSQLERGDLAVEL